MRAGKSRFWRRVSRQLSLALCLAISLIAMALGPASAMAAVKWQVQTSWGPTAVAPGGEAQFALFVKNIGDSTSNGVITVVDRLPQGMSATGFEPTEPADSGWSCSGTTVVVCTTLRQVTPYLDRASAEGPNLRRVFIDATAKANASGTKENIATVSGGGAPVATTQARSVTYSTEPVGFGIIPDSFDSGVFDAAYPDGEPEQQAGTHPYEMRVDFETNERYGLAPNSGVPYTDTAGHVRTVEVTLPRGLIGNPESVPKCSVIDFLSQGSERLETAGCPPDTQVGYMSLRLANGFGGGGYSNSTFDRVAIYNMQPPTGEAADFGFRVGSFATGHIYASLDPSHDYAIRSTTPYIPNIEGVRSARVTFWGVPADPSHDIFRAYQMKFMPDGVSEDPAAPHYGAPYAAATVRPFMTLPMDCGVDNGPFHIRADSWNHPEEFTPTTDAVNHLEVAGCEDQRVRFHPQITLNPTSRAADGPTGLDVHLEVPQRDQTVENYEDLYAKNGDLHGIDTPPMKKVVVTFPQGMTLSTSAAQGLTGCTPEEIGLGSNAPVTCPDSSQYGQLTLHTPILPKDEPLRGYIYIAQQNHNPFGTFLAMYFVIEDPSRGLRIKIPGKLELDPESGQITTTFDDLPQFPLTDMQLTFKGGVRAGLVNPPTCGAKTITATFYSWAAPQTPITKSSSYEVTEKPNGSPCINDLAERQFKPQFSAGTISPSAGSYSPFVFRLQRSDEDQEFSQLTTTLPPGLLANISNLTECPQAGIAQAEEAGRTGHAEELFPSCPASSQLGTTEVGSGVGQVITYIPGKVYLAGPYKGAPLSLVVISPITPGPYDLGVIAVRSAIYIDGEHARATIATDPFPQIYQGIPVRIRDVRVATDTPQTTLNPTNCNPMAVTAHLTGTGGDLHSTADDTAVDLSDRFQAANCASLGFKPSLTFRLKGGTRRGQFPAFKALLRARPGDANIARSTVVLPGSQFLEQGHIRTVCTRVQYAADRCPADSVYGTAKAKSPLFDEVLEGPVYLRSNGGERLLPDLVVKLNGKIEVTLNGFIDSIKGRIRNTFDVVPDAPVTYFQLSMQGGKKGLLVNDRDLCTAPLRASVKLIGQNGKTHDSRPKVAVDCGKAKRKK